MALYYYVSPHGQQMGPVSKEVLIQMGIGRQTLVWTEGMANWTPAEQVPDLASIFSYTPGPQPQPLQSPYASPYGQQRPVNTVGKPDTYLWLGILTTILCCLPFGIVSIVFASKVDNCWSMGDYQGAAENSDKAKLWGLIAAGSGIAFGIIYFVILSSTFGSIWF